MKKGLLYFFIFSLSIVQSYGQCPYNVYVFNEGRLLEYPMLWALVKDMNAFATYEIEELKGKGITKDYPKSDGMAIDLDGKVQKLKYADMAKDYAGFIAINRPYRMCEVTWDDQNTAWRAIGIRCMGDISVYGQFYMDNPKEKKNGGYTYDYCALSDGNIYISHKIDGKAYIGTSENFSLLLGEINMGVKDAYIAELNTIPSLKMKDEVHKNKKSFDLFVKYVEIINNQEYQD